MIYGKYCPACKNGICLGSIASGRKQLRCEEITSTTWCDWYEEQYIKYLTKSNPPKISNKEAIKERIKKILLYNFRQTHCVTCARIEQRDDRCRRCESYWELDEWTLDDVTNKIMKVVEI